VAQARATAAEVAKIQLSLKLAMADALRDEDAAAAGASPPAESVDGDAAAAGEAGEAAGGLPAPAPERRPIPAALEEDADVLRRRWRSLNCATTVVSYFGCRLPLDAASQVTQGCCSQALLL